MIDAAEDMANTDPANERTLFVLAMLFASYLRISDLVSRENWRPKMGDFRRDTMGNRWFHVIGKGNKAAKISVRDNYIEHYLVRYRRFLKLSALPSPQEQTPLITTLKGRGGLSDRHVRVLLQRVSDRALNRMQDEGWSGDGIDQLRSASLHWLRHTAATFDAPFRDMKDPKLTCVITVLARHNTHTSTAWTNNVPDQLMG